MVGVSRRRDSCGGSVQRQAAVDVLDPRELSSDGVVGGPHAVGGAWLLTVHVPAEHGGACLVVPGEDPPELGALGVIGASRLGRVACAQMRRADADRAGRRDAEPATLLRTRLTGERLVVRGPDAFPGEYGESEHAASRWCDAGQGLAVDEDGREAHPVADPASHVRRVATACLVEGHGLRVLGHDLLNRLLHDGGVGGPGVAVRRPGQAEVHLQNRVRRAGFCRSRGRRDGLARGDHNEGGDGQDKETGKPSHGLSWEWAGRQARGCRGASRPRRSPRLRVAGGRRAHRCARFTSCSVRRRLRIGC